MTCISCLLNVCIVHDTGQHTICQFKVPCPSHCFEWLPTVGYVRLTSEDRRGEIFQRCAGFRDQRQMYGIFDCCSSSVSDTILYSILYYLWMDERRGREWESLLMSEVIEAWFVIDRSRDKRLQLSNRVRLCAPNLKAMFMNW